MAFLKSNFKSVFLGISSVKGMWYHSLLLQVTAKVKHDNVRTRLNTKPGICTDLVSINYMTQNWISRTDLEN